MFRLSHFFMNRYYVLTKLRRKGNQFIKNLLSWNNLALAMTFACECDTLQKLPTSHLLAKAWQRTPISWDNSGWERPTVWHATYWIVTVDKVVKESDHENGIFFLRLLACALRFFCIRVFAIKVFPDSGIILHFRLTWCLEFP